MTTYYEIPISITDSNFTQITDLDGTEYELTFTWNQREDKWYLKIALDGTTLASGMKIVHLYDMLTNLTDPRLPQGGLYFIDTRVEFGDPGLRDLDTGYFLFVK